MHISNEIEEILQSTVVFVASKTNLQVQIWAEGGKGNPSEPGILCPASQRLLDVVVQNCESVEVGE